MTAPAGRRQKEESMKRLPDFIFGRRIDGPGKLAGLLVTDIPKGQLPANGEIGLVMSDIWEAFEADPTITQVGLWRGGLKPAEGLSPPFPDVLMKARCEACVCVAVVIEDDDHISFDWRPAGGPSPEMLRNFRRKH
jgi:hypothetical protein